MTDCWTTPASTNSGDDYDRFAVEESDGPFETAVRNAVHRALHRCLQRLPATHRQVLRLSFCEGLTLVEIAERIDHPLGTVKCLSAALEEGSVSPLLVLQGRMSPKQRQALTAALKGLAPDAPRVLLATGKLVGEGFDHTPLDTLVLAMPISWKGTLQQYAGRLHREHADKTDVQIIDFVDAGHPALFRMWEKRKQGYRAMGYRMGVDERDGEASQLKLDA